MKITKEEIFNLDKLERLNIINSITGIKPANLIGTVSEDQVSNLAIFSSVVHLGSNPALLGMILRPETEVRRHTFENIKSSGYYTINHVHESFIENAHYTSAKFEAEESEFEKCQLTATYESGFKAPFVEESKIKIGMKFMEALPIRLNDTVLVIGEIQLAILPDHAIDHQGHIDLTTIDAVGISGLNSYYTFTKAGHFPYARPEELPDFKK